jgi:ABC-type transport system involved in multi-copper enzyme maturation permease subunit
MGIYKEGYRRFEGTLHGSMWRVFTIFKNEFKRRLKNRWIILLIILSWFLGVLPILFGAPFIAYFVFTFVWIVIPTAALGGPILSEDFQYNSITLYLSRPLNRLDYFLGKYLTLFGLISLIALLPNIFISVYIIGTLYGTSTETLDYYKFALSLIGMGLLITFIFTNIGMAFSASTKNYKYASAGIIIILYFSNVLSLALSNLYDDIAYLSIWANLMIIFSDWNGLTDNTLIDQDVNIAYIVLILISLFCLAIVWYRIKRAELSE